MKDLQHFINLFALGPSSAEKQGAINGVSAKYHCQRGADWRILLTQLSSESCIKPDCIVLTAIFIIEPRIRESLKILNKPGKLLAKPETGAAASLFHSFAAAPGRHQI